MHKNIWEEKAGIRWLWILSIIPLPIPWIFLQIPPYDPWRSYLDICVCPNRDGTWFSLFISSLSDCSRSPGPKSLQFAVCSSAHFITTFTHVSMGPCLLSRYNFDTIIIIIIIIINIYVSIECMEIILTCTTTHTTLLVNFIYHYIIYQCTSWTCVCLPAFLFPKVSFRSLFCKALYQK